ncbi:MAG: hypothetical protein IKX70_03135 [Treponema sp.]|nr:hypothetical protein [Treponema sp.]
MKKIFKSLACAAALLILSTAAFANDYIKFKGWKQAETTHFRFIYETASEEAAKKYAEFADEAWEKIAEIYSMPQEKTDVYVFSRLNVVNAYTYFSPPEIVMFDSPVIDSYFGLRDDWMKLFFTHELIHIANITFEDKDYLAAKIFGELIRGSDYSSIPGWALEGLTTVLETELTNGGRGRSPYFELDFKAPTLDNNFIPYRLIGSEQEPPYGQIYVMGYLIMRSIADRCGIQALADIERNRTDGRSWEESVKLVTGKTPQDIYREVKIALQKKYSNERKIPEGKIISPNNPNLNYCQPAIIFDDGSMIALSDSPQTGSAAVYLDPTQNDGVGYYDDYSFTPKETILFKANFHDSRAITADENKAVYFSAADQRLDRNPGYETRYSLYKWTKETDIVQLTKDESSYFQPTVSRDGKILIAVEQSGLKMRLVQIDTESGEKTVLFQDERYSFIQPALNADGTQLAFVLVKNDRACIALADMKTKEYKIVNNTEHDFITDPSAPSFNKDGTLNFCSNDRGRLEVFEVTPNSDGTTFSYTPAVSDPIGALWAYKNDIGVFYLSYASTGNVIKIKPLEEWKVVPDFDGPSPAGQIMTFRALEDDYPDFDPVAVMTDARKQPNPEAEEDTEAVSEDTEEIEEAEEPEKDTKKKKKDDKNTVKHRSDEAIEKLDNLEPAVTELQNEKAFLGKITPVLYSPFISFVSDKDDYYLGVGGFVLAQTARVQTKQGFMMADAFFYPTIKNFTGDFALEIPAGTGTFDLYLGRGTSISAGLPGYDKDMFSLTNIALAGYTHPIVARANMNSTKVLSALFYAGGTFNQQAEKAFAVNADIPYTKAITFHTGFDFSTWAKEHHNFYTEYSFVNLLLGNYDFTTNKMLLGFEGEYTFTAGNNKMKQEISTVVRYTDFPSATIPFLSRAHLAGKTENCLFPGKVLLNYAYIFPGILGGMADGAIKLQGLASFGKNSDGTTPSQGTLNVLNFKLEKEVALNLELDFPVSQGQNFTGGVSFLFDLSNKQQKKPDINLYIACKMNWLRF